jgi:Lrp/AsnC family leucine-responsive transcriptional regulator
MDETDLRLCQILIVNSRAPYREIAERLGLSVQAIHRRIQSLVDDGVIRAFTTRLSIRYLNAMQAYIFGTPGLTSFKEVVARLRENDSTQNAIATSSNGLFVVALLRNISELEGYVDFVSRAVSMPAPGVALEGTTQFLNAPDRPAIARDATLSAIDYRILHSLHGNSRKAVEDISTELGVSAKTVRRHLDRMVAEGVVEFGIDFEPASSPGVGAFIIMELRPGSDRAAVRRELAGELGSSLFTITTSSNLPDSLSMMSWSPTNMKHRQLVDRIGAHPAATAVRSYLAQEEHTFETWRDRLIDERARCST